MKSFLQHPQPMGAAVLKSNNSSENRLSVKKQNRTLKSQKRKQQFVHFRALRNIVPSSQAFVQGKAFLLSALPYFHCPLYHSCFSLATYPDATRMGRLWA